MGLRKDKRTGRYIADFQFTDWPRLRVSLGTPNKEHAKRLHKVLEDVRVHRRRELWDAVKAGKLKVNELVAYVETRGVAVQAVSPADLGIDRPVLPTLGELLPDWYKYLEDPATISKRSRRRLAQSTIDRYKTSMRMLLAVLPNGEATTLAELTDDLVADLRRQRVGQGAARGFHRDLTALSALLDWCRRKRRLAFVRPELADYREHEPIEAFEILKPGDLERLLEISPPAYRPLWVLLTLCGLRIEEAMTLRVDQLNRYSHGGMGSVRLHEQYERLKTRNSPRTVPVLAPHVFWPLMEPLCLGRTAGMHLLPEQLRDYHHVEGVWKGLAKRLGYVRVEEVRTRTGEVVRGRQGKPRTRRAHTITLHDLRHTYAIMMLRAGYDVEELRQFMGHGSVKELDRYLRHEAGEEQAVSRAGTFCAKLGLPST